MKIPVMNAENKKTGEKSLPKQFSEPVRKDLIKRAVQTIQSYGQSAYGSDPMAGKRSSIRLSKKRHDYRGAYGRGQSRIPRKIMSRRGTQINLTAAFAPGTVGGRRAHPPKAGTIKTLTLNNKERDKAIRSAMAATFNTEYLNSRNAHIPQGFPFLLAGDFEKLSKTTQVNKALNLLGFADMLAKSKQTTVRAGKGTLRGRKKTNKKGPLIVVSSDCALAKSARNIKGCDVISLDLLSCEHLAPGTHPGRLTLYTEQVIDMLEKEARYMPKVKK